MDILYHINKAKQTGADAVIVALSGDYVQRGEYCWPTNGLEQVRN